MWLFTQIVAEDRIQQAMKEGKFDDLPGVGKPLPPDEADRLPPELRMAYRVLKNAGYVSAEASGMGDIERAIEQLEFMRDEGERTQMVKKLNFMIMKVNQQRGRPVSLEVADDYLPRIQEKLRLAEERFRENESV